MEILCCVWKPLSLKTCHQQCQIVHSYHSGMHWTDPVVPKVDNVQKNHFNICYLLETLKHLTSWLTPVYLPDNKLIVKHITGVLKVLAPVRDFN